MKILTITNGFAKLTDANLDLRANQIHTAMNGNANFPSPVPSMDTFGDAILAFSAALNESRDGDRLKVAIKNQKRDELVDILHLLADFVLFKSAGDSVIAISSGFSIGKQPAPAPPITKPENLRVLQGENSGQLSTKVKQVKGAKSYLHQYATDVMMAQNNWLNIFCTRSSCMIDDLQPGTKYNVRVAAVGPKDQLVYSDVVSRIVA
jgi:Fibronectin type III domain